MLKLNKDHWKKRAEDAYYSALTDQEKMKQEEQDKKDWDRRYKEGNWLLKGVAKVDDSNMGHLLEEKLARDGRNKYIPEAEQKKKKKAAKEKAGVAAVPQPKTNYLEAVKSWLYPKVEKKSSRVRNARFVIKEGIATMLVSRDVQREREEFILRNSDQIRVIQNARLRLQYPRLPAHHTDLSEMNDAEPPMSAEVAVEISERNLRTYVIPELQRIIEPLRSVDEVKNEEIQGRLHWVPSRFHQFLGLHRIFALRCAPGTHDVLYGKHVAKETYIEDTLLPDYASMEREKHEERKRRKWLTSRIVKIKKDKLDMARKQFRFNTPVAPDVIADGVDVRYSEKFQWNQRQIEERNSVYSQSHGTVTFAAEPLPVEDSTSVRDDSTTDTSVKYYMISDASVSQAAACTTGQTVAASLSTFQDMESDLCYSDEFASENALRSNFFSTGSTRSNRLVRVKFERFRKIKGLRGKHVKGISLESRRTQEMRQEERSVAKQTRPHTAS